MGGTLDVVPSVAHLISMLYEAEEYLGLEGGPPIFKQDFSCPALLKNFV